MKRKYTKNPVYTEEQWQKIREEYKSSELTYNDISKKYNISKKKCHDNLKGIKPGNNQLKTIVNIGDRFGTCQIIGTGKRQDYITLKCDCGRTITRKKYVLNNYESCGCLKKEKSLKKKEELLKEKEEKKRLRLEIKKLKEELGLQKKLTKEKKQRLKTEEIGKKYNHLTILGPGEKKFHLNCLCDCGKIKEIGKVHVINNLTKSCGCNKGYKKHGESKTKTYNSWRGMHKRCLDPNNVAYDRYGGKGITICDRWLSGLNPPGVGYKNFKEDMGERPEDRTLDRINPKGNYEPSNCRWATVTEQSRNQKRFKNKKWQH